MLSAAIWLLSLASATFAQYGQQQYTVKLGSTQIGIDNPHAIGNSLRIPTSKRKYFPPPAVPLPDFKYVNSRKQMPTTRVSYEFRNSALQAFINANGKVKFSIRNLGPNPSYGPFSGTQFGVYGTRSSGKDLLSGTSGKQNQTSTYDKESVAGAAPSGCAGMIVAPRNITATTPQTTTQSTVVSSCIFPPSTPPPIRGGQPKGTQERTEEKSSELPASTGQQIMKIIPPTGPGTHLGPVSRPSTRPMPPSLRPPSKQNTVSGSRKNIHSSLSSSELEAMSSLESNTSTSVQSETRELLHGLNATAAPKVVSGSRNDILSELALLQNTTSSRLQTSKKTSTSKQTEESKTEIVTETHTGSSERTLSTNAQSTLYQTTNEKGSEKTVEKAGGEGTGTVSSEEANQSINEQISEGDDSGASNQYTGPPVFVPLKVGTSSIPGKSSYTSNITFEFGNHHHHKDSLSSSHAISTSERNEKITDSKAEEFERILSNAPNSTLTISGDEFSTFNLWSNSNSNNVEKETIESIKSSATKSNFSLRTITDILESKSERLGTQKSNLTKSASQLLISQGETGTENSHYTSAPTPSVVTSVNKDRGTTNYTGDIAISSTDNRGTAELNAEKGVTPTDTFDYGDDEYDEIGYGSEYLPGNRGQGPVGPDGRPAGEERQPGRHGVAPPGFGPPKAVPPVAVSIPQYTVTPAASFTPVDNTSNSKATPSPSAVPPALLIPMPSFSSLPQLSLEGPAPSTESASVPAPAPVLAKNYTFIGSTIVPVIRPESVPAPLPGASLPQLPSEYRPEPLQYLPFSIAPTSPAPVPLSTPPLAPLPQPVLPPSELPQPSGISAYETDSNFVRVPSSQSVVPPPSHIPIPIATQGPIPAPPQASLTWVAPPDRPNESTTTAVGLPAGLSPPYEGPIPSPYLGPAIPPNGPAPSPAVPPIPKYEEENQIGSVGTEETEQSIYGHEVQPAVEVDEDRQLSRSEGPLPLQPIDNGEGEESSEEYYDNETEASPDVMVGERGRGHFSEQKFGSRVVTTKAGIVPYQSQVQVPAAAPETSIQSTASKKSMTVSSNYEGLFGSSNGASSKNVLTERVDKYAGNINGNFGGGNSNYAGGPGGLVGGVSTGSYSGPGAVPFGGVSAVSGFSQGSYGSGGQVYGGRESYGGRPLGGGQTSYIVAPIGGGGGDGCCGGNWLSRNGGFCTPVNFSPCLPNPSPISCKCCCCCCPGSRCAPAQPLCQSSCMSSCCRSGLPGFCIRRKKRTAALRYLKVCR